MGGFKPVSLDQIPIPQAAPPTQYTPPQIDQPPSQQPRGAGSMTAGGKVADIGANFLSGWLKGKQQAEQKKLAMAQQNVSGAQYAFQIAQQNAAQVANDPNATPEQKKQSEAARVAAWKAYLDIAQKYTEPQKGAKGSGGKGSNPIKDHLKSAFGAEDPHIFSQGTMAILRTVGPPSLPMPSEKEKFENKTAKTLNDAIDKLQEAQRSGDPKRIEEAQKNYQTTYQQANGQFQTETQKLDDAMASATTKYMKGEQISQQEKDVLQAHGYIPKPVEKNVWLQTDDKGFIYAVTYDPTTGKTTKSENSIMKTRVPPDQVQEAYQIYQQKLKMASKLLKQAHPDWTDEQIAQEQAKAVLSESFGIKVARGMSPQQSQRSVSSAINEVYNTMLTPEEKEQAGVILDRVQGVGGGGYMFRKDFKDATGVSGWWDRQTLMGLGKEKHSGLTEEQANAIDGKVRNMVRGVMHDKMGMDPDQIDALVPETIGEERSKYGMDPTPDQAQSKGTASKQGEGPTADEVSVVAPDGTVGAVKKSDLQNFLKNNPGYKQQ
jgi:hypothetical protein